MALFRFKQRQVADPLAQQNFEQLGDTLGSGQLSGPSGSTTTADTAQHALAGGPSIVVSVAGAYVVRFEGFVQSQANGLFQGNILLAKNGVSTGQSVIFVGQVTFDGATISGERVLTLARGDVLSLIVASNNTVSTSYSLGVISIRPA
jgi:hypothetical protein